MPVNALELDYSHPCALGGVECALYTCVLLYTYTAHTCV